MAIILDSGTASPPRQTDPEEGRKFDGDKPRWSLFPPHTLQQVLAVLEYGAQKYAQDNWKNVDNARERYYNALQRHVDAWWHGETQDPETGNSHLAHAACSILFLMWLDDHRGS